MGFTNADLKKAIDQFGERICGIGLNNGKTLLLGYNSPNSSMVKDLKLTSMGNTDVIGVPNVDKGKQTPVHYTTYITTEFIESLIVVSEEDEQYRVDPIIMK